MVVFSFVWNYNQFFFRAWTYKSRTLCHCNTLFKTAQQLGCQWYPTVDIWLGWNVGSTSSQACSVQSSKRSIAGQSLVFFKHLYPILVTKTRNKIPLKIKTNPLKQIKGLHTHTLQKTIDFFIFIGYFGFPSISPELCIVAWFIKKESLNGWIIWINVDSILL